MTGIELFRAKVREELGGLSVPKLAVISLINFALAGCVIPLVWRWFLTPLGVPTIGWAQTIGLLALSRAFFSGTDAGKKWPKTTMADRLASVLGKWAFVISVAWLARQFV